MGDSPATACLELGVVRELAQVRLNGQDLGIAWKEPFRVEATEALRAGTNELEIQVTNLWPNRMIGDERLPPDSDRNPNGTLRVAAMGAGRKAQSHGTSFVCHLAKL